LPAYENGGIKGQVMLAFGDSITRGFGSSSGGPQTAYPMRLENMLEPFFGGHFVSINSGVNGESTGGGSKRFVSMLQQYKPDLLLLLEGTNDHGKGDDFGSIESRLRWMISAAQQFGAKVIIGTIPPVISTEERDRAEQQMRIQAFNPRIYKIASDYGIPVAPVYEAITANRGWETKYMDRSTGNHPNDAGYQFVVDAFFKTITTEIENGGLY
jgi:lysophospholipase L1-like esterase